MQEKSRDIAGIERVICGHVAERHRHRYVALMADEEDEETTKRIDLTVSVQTHRYLTALKKRGTHGGSVAKVARSLIESGIRETIDKGYIPLDAGEK